MPAANSAPLVTLMSAETRTTRSARRRSGSTGSAARRSRTTKPTRPATTTTPRPTIAGDPHGTSRPPRLAARTVPPSVTVSSSEPA